MAETDNLYKIQDILRKGMILRKCKKCGCMKDALITLKNNLPSINTNSYSNLLKEIDLWLYDMQDIKYSCLGCDYCYGAKVTNIFDDASFSNLTKKSNITHPENKEKHWPMVPGEYIILRNNASCPIAISTLGSVELAEEIAKVKPKRLCIVGKTETENIGIEKVIKNIIANSNIRYLLLVGIDPKGHNSGNTLMALSSNGVDENMKVIGSTGKRPTLVNVTREETKDFRKQVQVIDMIGCKDIEKIQAKITELIKNPVTSSSCKSCHSPEFKPVIKAANILVIEAKEPAKIELDKAGYFVIIPQPKENIITVEHYSYDNKLLQIIKGNDIRVIYFTIIKNGWVTQLSHAAYIGKELAKAELSIKLGFKYVQEGA
ncbi:MAG: hypothetical protein M1308_23860 [Actinobacteria bacterium]|nr:hypothetical protein [Actinomycetota bacterium]